MESKVNSHIRVITWQTLANIGNDNGCNDINIAMAMVIIAIVQWQCMMIMMAIMAKLTVATIQIKSRPLISCEIKSHISFRLSKSSLMLKLKTFMPPTMSRTLARAYQGRKLYRDMNSFFLKFGKFDLFCHNQLSGKM